MHQLIKDVHIVHIELFDLLFKWELNMVNLFDRLSFLCLISTKDN